MSVSINDPSLLG